MNAPRRIMAHMIPFYPDLERSRRVAQALIDGGAAYLEIQFPYSDPTADGPAIQGATAAALDAGFRVEQGWAFVAGFTGKTAPPVFLMSYAGLVFSAGVERFVARAAEVGVHALIVPDLPIDSDEGLYAAGRANGVEIVPVISFGAGDERIRLAVEAGTRWIYAALRRGTTGADTTIDEQNIAFVERLAERGAGVMAGFGISRPDQVQAVTEHAHAAVVGSAFVRAVADHADPYEPVRSLAARLTGIDTDR